MRTGRRSAQRRALGGHIASRVLRAGELRVALTAGLLLAQPLFVDALQDLADRGRRKPTRCQKARLLRAVSRRFRQLAELFAPHGLRSRQLGFAQIGPRFFDERAIQRMLLQFTDDTARAKTRLAPMNQAFREARIRQPVLGFERIEHSVERIRFFDERFQLAREFRAAVFAAG